MNRKFLFPLYANCASVGRQTCCRCPSNKRVISGSWATPELELALEMEYKIVEREEVVHWENTTQCDPTIRKGGLFYRTKNGKTVCKIQGFTLNYRASQVLNFGSVKNLILSGLDPKDNPVYFDHITTTVPIKHARRQVSQKP